MLWHVFFDELYLNFSKRVLHSCVVINGYTTKSQAQCRNEGIAWILIRRVIFASHKTIQTATPKTIFKCFFWNRNWNGMTINCQMLEMLEKIYICSDFKARTAMLCVCTINTPGGNYIMETMWHTGVTRRAAVEQRNAMRFMRTSHWRMHEAFLFIPTSILWLLLSFSE